MAVAGFEVSAATPEPVSTFTMSIGGPGWKPPGTPSAGDLVVLHVLKPVAVDYVTDSGGGTWWRLPSGDTWWNVIGPHTPSWVTFHARDGSEWEIRGWVVAAGTYELPAVSAAQGGEGQ